MKKFLPDNVLLTLTVVLTGLMVFYNISLRDTFGVTLAYKYPGLPEPQPIRAVSPAPVPEQTGDTLDNEAGYDSGYAEESGLTSVGFPLDLNLATVDELKFIPRVGDVTAQRIVQYREVLGSYTSLEQLKEIKGIGDVLFDSISAYLII